MSERMYEALKDVRSIRESSLIPRADRRLLIAESGSSNPETARKAKERLFRLFELQPERDSQSAETVDLMAQFEKFSPKEQEEILKNLVALELTKGCNGGCPFCYLGEKKGVTHKFSFDSIKEFFNKYKDDISEKTLLYWNSDPFDYRDGKKTFIDVYSAWRKIRPDSNQYVSTSIPKGGEDDFILFTKEAMKEQILRLSVGKKTNLTIRLSVGRRNVQRVEMAMERLVNEISHSDSPFTKEEIDIFFKNCFEVQSRIIVLPLGSLFEKHDDIRDFGTPACSDGTVIGPFSTEAMLVTFPTVYEPYGYKKIELISGKVIGSVPKFFRVMFKQTYPLTDVKDISDALGFFEYEMVRNPKEEEFTLPNKTEDLVLKLGREAQAIANMINGLSQINNEKFKDLYKEKDHFIEHARDVFRKREPYLLKKVYEAEKLAESGNVKGESLEQLKFYTLLAKVYLSMGDFLAHEIGLGRRSNTIGAMAKVLGQIGKDQAPHVDKIIGGLLDIEKAEFPLFLNKRKKFIEDILYKKVGKFFFSKKEGKPYWFYELAGAVEEIAGDVLFSASRRRLSEDLMREEDNEVN